MRRNCLNTSSLKFELIVGMHQHINHYCQILWNFSDLQNNNTQYIINHWGFGYLVFPPGEQRQFVQNQKSLLLGQQQVQFLKSSKEELKTSLTKTRKPSEKPYTQLIMIFQMWSLSNTKYLSVRFARQDKITCHWHLRHIIFSGLKHNDPKKHDILWWAVFQSQQMFVQQGNYAYIYH
jgi:hypothetical protein